MPVLKRQMQRRALTKVLRIDLGSPFEKQTHYLLVSLLGRLV
jgi:hypothetical protein